LLTLPAMTLSTCRPSAGAKPRSFAADRNGHPRPAPARGKRVRR